MENDDYNKILLRRAGEIVRARLASNPAVYKVPVKEVELFAVGNFLNEKECDNVINMIDAVAQPSELYDSEYSSGYRTSYSANFDHSDSFVRNISLRIDDILGLESNFGETIQGQRYMPGQKFKPHHDWFHSGTNYWDLEMTRGGQRSFTAMVYLNHVEAGGRTDFPDIGVSLEPKQGVLVIWNNAMQDGSTNRKTLHAGQPVIYGKKYVITKWYRAREWRKNS